MAARFDYHLHRVGPSLGPPREPSSPLAVTLAVLATCEFISECCIVMPYYCSYHQTIKLLCDWQSRGHADVSNH